MRLLRGLNDDRVFKPFIFNATPLIYLCKIGLSRIFTEFVEDKYTTPKVFEEAVIRGKRLGAPDAFAIEHLIEDSILKVRQPEDSSFVNRLMEISGLHKAEAEVLALTRELDGIAIIDESIAREVARIYNIEAHGTIYLLLRLMYRGSLPKEDVRNAIERMISAGWRLSAEEYAKLIRHLETV